MKHEDAPNLVEPHDIREKPDCVPMKVLFYGFWLTHYFRDFFNHLNRVPGMTVLHIHPSGKNRHMGEAVYQTDEGVEFKSFRMQEVVVPACRPLGLSDLEWKPAYNDFRGAVEFLRAHRPDVVVVDASYHRAFAFNRRLRQAVAEVGCRVVFRSIPFQLPTLEEAIARAPQVDRIPMRSNRALRVVLGSLGLDRLYARFVRNPALLRQATWDRHVFCRADAHVVYHEGGIPVYQSWGVLPSRIHVVRNSPDTDKLLAARARVLNSEDVFTNQPRRIIHVGRLVEWKRVDLLVRAVAALHRDGLADLELLVVGYGPCEGTLKALVAELGISEFVTFRGGIYDQDELARCFLSSSVYVLAGMGGLSINEAMCFALPIICSRCDGTEKFLVRERVNGAYFKEGDLDDLVAKIRETLADEPRRLAMGQFSLHIITEEMNIQTLVNNYMRLFRTLVQPADRRR